MPKIINMSTNVNLDHALKTVSISILNYDAQIRYTYWIQYVFDISAWLFLEHERHKAMNYIYRYV